MASSACSRRGRVDGSGLFATVRLLKRLRQLANPGAQILAQTLDPYESKNPDHLAYHAWNRAKGRMSGQIRMRARYKTFRTPWFDYLFVSREELAEIVQGTGWRVSEVISGNGPDYVAVLGRET